MDERNFQIRKLFFVESIRMMTAFCVKGLQLLFLTNIGAVAVLLFLMSRRLFVFSVTLVPLGMFFLSSVLASATLCLSYLAQLFYCRETFSGNFSEPGVFFHLLAVLSAFGAYGACFYGMWRTYLIFMGA